MVRSTATRYTRGIFLLFAAWPALAAQYILDFNEQPRSCVAHEENDWGYYGQVSLPHERGRRPILLPLDWGRHFDDCGHLSAPLNRQSPIELPAVEGDMPPAASGDVVFQRYDRHSFTVENKCHTVQATPVKPPATGQAPLLLDGQPYRLLQFHLHTPSEHVFDTGEHGTVNYPVEMHFVHAAALDSGSLDSSRLVVVALFLDIAHGGVRAETSIDAAVSSMANSFDAGSTDAYDHPGLSIDLDMLLAGHTGRFYRYKGSLTTPPCSEIVDWIVLAQPAIVSSDTFRMLQLRKLDVGFANNRPPFPATRAHRLRYRTD